VKFPLESFPVLAHATADQVRDGLALDREKILEARNAVITDLQRAANRGQALEDQWILFASVHDDHWRAIGQLAQGPESREPKRHLFFGAAPLPQNTIRSTRQGSSSLRIVISYIISSIARCAFAFSM
jgi:hypothetical protein